MNRCDYCQQENGHLAPSCPSAQSERLVELQEQLTAERAKVAELERQLDSKNEALSVATTALEEIASRERMLSACWDISKQALAAIARKERG